MKEIEIERAGKSHGEKDKGRERDKKLRFILIKTSDFFFMYTYLPRKMIKKKLKKIMSTSLKKISPS